MTRDEVMMMVVFMVREEPNLVSLMMREGVRRRGVSRAGSAPPPSPPPRFSS